MNRIVEKFDRLREKKEKAFIPFITLGYPDLSCTENLVLELEKRGADLIELGIPFSDPLADGSIIQRASHEALRNGVTLKGAIKLVEQLRKKTQIPLVFMGYYNPILKMGEKRFANRAHQAGVDGVIVADLPPEEAVSLSQSARESGLALIFLLTPVSPDRRIKLISLKSQGFIYCVSYTGITGEGKGKEKKLRSLLEKIRTFSPTPVAVGFGISSPREAEAISHFADGVIVGSAIIRKIMENKNQKDMVNKVGEFALSLCESIKSVS